ncbi:MAG: TlpA family protein disulfide reductase [Bacteroidetes bacterium]|nr:TlpA family protein disulfide reductase [Bacteroidota bacterium]
MKKVVFLLLLIYIICGFRVSKKNQLFTQPTVGLGLGNKAPNILLPNLNDSLIELWKLPNTLVLIDFWASWCAPCRAENPNVVKLFNEFKEKGFSVFSVSLDMDKHKWADAITKDKLVWSYHVCDFKMWNSSAVKDYAVQGIPTNVLIDKNGIIIAKNLTSKKLITFIRKYYETS